MDEKELFERALQEIKNLRSQRALMKARLDMFDDVMSALHGKPGSNQEGLMAPDIVYEIEKYLSNDTKK